MRVHEFTDAFGNEMRAEIMPDHDNGILDIEISGSGVFLDLENLIRLRDLIKVAIILREQRKG